jgi:hypothetical protein
MWVRQSFENQEQSDPEWLKEIAIFLNKNGNKKKFITVKKIFVEAYLENIREGMNPKEALQKAKSVALCFLIIHQ